MPAKRQHGGDSDGDAEDACDHERQHNGDADDQSRTRRRFHGDREALDDVGAVTGGGCLGHTTNRTIFRAGVVFRDPDRSAGNNDADHCTSEQPPPVNVVPFAVNAVPRPKIHAVTGR